MLSRSQIQFIKSLQQKKFRKEHGLFVAEGVKIMADLLNSSMAVRQIFSTAGFLPRLDALLGSGSQPEVIEISENELNRISAQESPQSVLAVCELPDYSPDSIPDPRGLSLVLDDIQDPGNTGTILRIADWFGIRDVICSAGTADCYNPKVVQASMGSLFRVRPQIMDLTVLFGKNKNSDQLPVYGALVDGENIFNEKLSSRGLILLGNESTGIRQELLAYITKRISIPSAHKGGSNGPDSLNVSIAAGIICSEFFRRENKTQITTNER